MAQEDKIVLNIFIDAFGWQSLQENAFLPEVTPHQHRRKSIFGYSSACIPAILMGCRPQEHGYWTSFYDSPKTSPFKFLKPLGLIPGFSFDQDMSEDEQFEKLSTHIKARDITTWRQSRAQLTS